MKRNIYKGELYYADLTPVVGSEQGGIRPVLVIQNNVGNKYSPTVIVAAITSKINSKAKLPTHVSLPDNIGLEKDSIVLLEQIRTIDKQRIGKFIGTINGATLQDVNNAIKVSIATEDNFSE